jgi:hypothetical protein
LQQRTELKSSDIRSHDKGHSPASDMRFVNQCRDQARMPRNPRHKYDLMTRVIDHGFSTAK